MKPLFLLLLFWFAVLAQATAFAAPRNEMDSFPQKKLFIIPEVQVMKSTHKNFFTGANVLVSYMIRPGLAIGGGAEFSYAPKHNDNGYVLYGLKYFPVFADIRFFLWNKGLIRPFLELSPGISFVRYKKEDRPGTPRYRVRERGFYTYGGGCFSFNFRNGTMFYIGIGFKGFHMSTNAYDVNPHGHTFRAGFVF